MEKATSRRVEAGNRKNARRNFLRGGALLLGVTLGPGILLANNASGESDDGSRPDRPSPTELSANGRAVDPALVVKAEHQKNVAILKYVQADQARKAAEEARRIALQTPGAVVDGRIVYNESLWSALHQCEQAETWHAGGHFGNGLVSGGNGLGMSRDAWEMAVEAAAEVGVALPSTGWEANIDQQMQAAQIFYKVHGWGWACQPWE